MSEVIQINHIYFDMDGVLADFDRGVRELCYMQPVIQGSGQKADDELWDAVRKAPHFYDRLELKPGAVNMFNKLYSEYGNACEILTGIPKPGRNIPGAGEDKTRWVHRILSPDVKVNIVYREQKPDYCHGQGDILIDNYENNIQKWEAMGGTGILFTSSDDVLETIRNIRGR